MEEDELLERLIPRLSTINVNQLKVEVNKRKIEVNNIEKLWDALIIHSILENQYGLVDKFVELIRVLELVIKTKSGKISNKNQIHRIYWKAVRFCLKEYSFASSKTSNNSICI
ncbi:MAG: hypothetical protein IPH04_11760 [Saprospirales bacterium]|nr:hypothetical protein [Saprospirales bacterium]